MELVRWRPTKNLPSLQDEMDRAFDRIMRGWGSPFSLSDISWFPAVDISDTGNEVVVRAETPGVSRDDLDISIENDQLIVSGEKRREEEEKEANYYRAERTYGSFRRVIALPAHVDPDKVKATYEKGVLTVTIPKMEIAKGRKVKIEGQ